jgi:hypothetical protein
LSLKPNEKKEVGILQAKYFTGFENQAFVYTSITYGAH